MDGPMNLNQDFQEFIELFISHNVRFMIVGGYAVAAHGHPRYTKDLDVWVWADPENTHRVVSALDEFGFGQLGLTAADFQGPDSVVQLGREPQRIDILTFATGLPIACLMRCFLVSQKKYGHHRVAILIFNAYC